MTDDRHGRSGAMLGQGVCHVSGKTEKDGEVSHAIWDSVQLFNYLFLEFPINIFFGPRLTEGS